jgi:hypothetical protein
MDLDYICKERFCKPWLYLLTSCLILLAQQASASTLNVTNFGAIGDCANITVSVTSNSTVVVTTNIFSGKDVGKIMCLFGAGYKSFLSSTGIFQGNYQGTPTNNQDMVVTILSVQNGTNVSISSACGVTANQILCTYGTQNKSAFDNCIAAAPNPCTILIPTGNYLLIPPTALDTNYVQTGQWDSSPTITIRKGGIHFLGNGTNLTILTGNGAWQQKGFDEAYRGYLFSLLAPVTNDGPLIFDSIQFNGNAARKHAGYSYAPAVPTDGSGWDPTHHPIIESGTAPGWAYKSYTNCLFTHWHGETLQGLFGGAGFLDVGNCSFVDGNATVFNSSLSHDYHNNSIYDYYQVEEFYEGYATNSSCFRFNLVTNIYGGGIVINGGVTNYAIPSYNIYNNTFYCNGKFGVGTTPALNVFIISNYFNNGYIKPGIAGYQGSSINKNFFIAFNTFTNAPTAIVFGSAGRNSSAFVSIISNTACVSEAFAENVSGAWITNVSLACNAANMGLDNSSAAGQWFLDSISDQFPPHVDSDALGINAVTYSWGMRHKTTAIHTNSIFYLDDSQPAQIPPTAILQVTNAGAVSILYTSTNLVNPITMTNGYSAMFQWTNNVWQLVWPTFGLMPPRDLRLNGSLQGP